MALSHSHEFSLTSIVVCNCKLNNTKIVWKNFIDNITRFSGHLQLRPICDSHSIQKQMNTGVDFINFFAPLRQNFMPIKASQKLGKGRKLFGEGCEPVYEIDPSGSAIRAPSLQWRHEPNEQQVLDRPAAACHKAYYISYMQTNVRPNISVHR